MKTTHFPLAAGCLLAVGALAPLHALAQSNVTLYGIADVLVEHRNHIGTATASRWALTSGGMNTSRWGLRGSEELGGGLKAVFQLEGEVAMDTGKGGDDLFGRQANVGLEGGFGRVIAGKSYSTTYDFVLPFDPMGYAPFYSWATSGGEIATNKRKDGMTTGVKNLVKYQGTFGPVKVGASYGFGEVAGQANAGRYTAVAAAYNAGPFAAMLGTEQSNGTNAGDYDKTKTFHWALSYDLSPVKLFLAQRRYNKDQAAAADLKSTMTWVGATWTITPKISLTPAFYKQDIKSGLSGTDDPKLLALRAKYDLSKRTSLYAVAAHAKSKNGGLVSVSRDDSGLADTQTGYGMGIQHRF